MPRPGSSQVSSATASDVEMEGGIEQQHTLSRTRRKRPPEDHADREWKRKDSDSAGQYSSAIPEIGRELNRCIEVNIEVLKTKEIEPDEVIRSVDICFVIDIFERLVDFSEKMAGVTLLQYINNTFEQA